MRKWTLFLTACVLFAQTPKGPEGDAPPAFVKAGGWTALLNGKDLTGWAGENGKSHKWFGTKSVSASGKTLNAEPGGGPAIVNGPAGKTANLVSDQKHGDVELYVEFMVPQGSNSGVYLQGLYEIQVFDSYGKATPTTSDGGAIYHRWINEKPVGGSAPKTNAQLPPGQWQSYHAWFRAPRFDASGKKTENATFLRVLHNGVQVQENVEVDGGTRAHMNIPEAAMNPLMLQGDHGPVAYRSIYIRPLREGAKPRQ
jgi:hypothetical protein